jgi:hypothetical protein
LDSVIAWIVSLIVSVAPVGRTQYLPDAKETETETTARYESIARDLVEVVYDQNEQPLFKDSQGRAKTAQVMLAVATYESGFRRDVDYGLGPKARGDGGKSWCLMQVLLGRPGKVSGKTRGHIYVRPDGRMGYTTNPMVGWGGEDLVNDRKACFRAGLAVLRDSFHSCGRQALRDRLSVYASGRCQNKGGLAASHTRMGLALRWMKNEPPQFNDEEVYSLLNDEGEEDGLTQVDWVRQKAEAFFSTPF